MAFIVHKSRGHFKPKNIPQHQHKHYWPYLPVLLMLIAFFALNLFQPFISRGILAYATEMSRDQLLQSTNAQRLQNGSDKLSINSKLNAAAQAKADDMVARNYWSHNTPDGKEPWTFIEGAGYKYLKAGENLAYGFSTSNATINGWMNSPTHKANMLDKSFTEVGFGYANSQSFNNSGPETVVVAEYGRPQVLSESASPSSAKPTNSAIPKNEASKVIDNPQTTSESVENTVVNSDSTTINSDSIPVSRIQNYTVGNTWLIFSIGLFTGLAITTLLVKHMLALRHLFKDTRKFVLHHPVLDTILVGIILVGSFLLQTNAFLK